MNRVRIAFLAFALIVVPAVFAGSPSWESKESPTSGAVRCLSICADGNLISGVFGGGVFIYNEETWNASNTGLNSLNVMGIAKGEGGTLYASTFGGGVFALPKGETAWQAINEGLGNLEVVSFAVSGDELYAGAAYGGVYKRSDPGAAWEYIGLREEFVSALAVDRAHRVFAGTDKGVFLLEPTGIAWKEASAGLQGKDVWALTVDKHGTVYAGTNGAGVLAWSRERGRWNAFKTQPADLHISSMVLESGNRFTVGTAKGVFQTIDSGVTWQRLGEDSENQGISALVMDASGDYFAATRIGALLKRVSPSLSIR